MIFPIWSYFSPALHQAYGDEALAVRFLFTSSIEASLLLLFGIAKRMLKAIAQIAKPRNSGDLTRDFMGLPGSINRQQTHNYGAVQCKARLPRMKASCKHSVGRAKTNALHLYCSIVRSLVLHGQQVSPANQKFEEFVVRPDLIKKLV